MANPGPGGAASQNILAAAPDLGLFSRLLRSTQQSAQENINEQLLENVDVQLIPEEEKKEESKEVLEEKARVEQLRNEQHAQLQRQTEEMAVQREQLMRQHSQFQDSLRLPNVLASSALDG